jgi:hypothetical protein
VERNLRVLELIGDMKGAMKVIKGQNKSWDNLFLKERFLETV